MDVDEIVRGTFENRPDLVRSKEREGCDDPHDGFRIFGNIRTLQTCYDRIIDGIAKRYLHKASDPDALGKLVTYVVGETCIIYGPTEWYDLYKHSGFFWKEIIINREHTMESSEKYKTKFCYCLCFFKKRIPVLGSF